MSIPLPPLSKCTKITKYQYKLVESSIQTASVAEWIGCRTRNRRVAGSIPYSGPTLCPWERHFTRISSPGPGGYGQLGRCSCGDQQWCLCSCSAIVYYVVMYAFIVWHHCNQISLLGSIKFNLSLSLKLTNQPDLETLRGPRWFTAILQSKKNQIYNKYIIEPSFFLHVETG